MTRAVARAIESGGQLLVEAGTGTGKSLAYLIPAALRALTTGGRAIVSTNTIALQEQLLEQDVPATRLLLRDALGDEAADALRVTTLKGRRNYLCRRRLAQERAAGAVAPSAGGAVTSEAGAAANRLLARLIIWLREHPDRRPLGVARRARRGVGLVVLQRRGRGLPLLARLPPTCATAAASCCAPAAAPRGRTS